ncbi:MAG: hypothetical protein KDD36_06680 [Flavobacteriales bacterium]|nr:hypothetical protein [Flavobacteriales bacterium]
MEELMMDPSIYSSLSRKRFGQLAATHDIHCISIYLPAVEEGRMANEDKRPLLLKNDLKELHAELERYKGGKNYVKNYLRPVELLLNNTGFWRTHHQALAMFLSGNGFVCFSLPISASARVYFGDHFYLQPLLPLFAEDIKFFVMTLTRHEMILYEGSSYGLTERLVKRNVPVLMGENGRSAQKMLQFRSGQEQGGRAMFHGQHEDNDKELVKFFKNVDADVMRLIGHETYPLVLACQGYHFTHFRRLTRYAHVHPEFIEGNPATVGINKLFVQASRLRRALINRMRNDKIKLFKELQFAARTSIRPDKIIPAAMEGRVDTLFVRESHDLFGLFDQQNRTVILDEYKKPGNASLVNMAAVNSFENGGQVYVMEDDEMPVRETVMNALFRY